MIFHRFCGRWLFSFFLKILMRRKNGQVIGTSFYDCNQISEKNIYLNHFLGYKGKYSWLSYRCFYHKIRVKKNIQAPCHVIIVIWGFGNVLQVYKENCVVKYKSKKILNVYRISVWLPENRLEVLCILLKSLCILMVDISY